MAAFEDISPKIKEKLENEINNDLSAAYKEQRIREKAGKGGADYRDALKFAENKGKSLKKAIKSIESSDLPNGTMYYNISEKALKPVLEDVSQEILGISSEVLESQFESMGVRLKPSMPDESEKIHGLLNLASSDEWDNVKDELSVAADTFSRQNVDDFIETNAEKAYSRGFEAKIIRTASGKACQWCEEVSGTYDYADVRKGGDVFRRHANCSCTVEFEPSRGNRELVSSKTTRANRKSHDPEEIVAKREERKQERLGRNARKRNNPDKIRVLSEKEGVVVSSKQFGKKAGKHAEDYGLNPSSKKDRDFIEQHIADIIDNHEKKWQGEWKDQPSPSFFYQKGNDVVVADRNKVFVTILKDWGINHD